MPGEDTEVVSAIFILNPDGGASRQVGPDVNRIIHWLFWTPDGQHLTYGARGLHTITLDGNEIRLATATPHRISGSIQPGERLWSPYGSWLVTARMKEDGAGRDLYIFPATGGTLRRLTNLPGFSSSPAWAPNGRTIYFVSGRREDTSNIWKFSMDPETGLATGEPQQVTFFKDTVVMAPKVLGDGSRIGFNMIKLNTYIQIADPSSPNEARSLVRCGKYLPELSPDGQTVYYVNDMPGEEGIYAVPRQGGAPRRLTESLPFEVRGCEYYRSFDLSPDTGAVPQWSPDGSQLAYADGNDLNVIPAAGGQPRKLAHISYFWEPYSVCWSPDGKFIAALGITKAWLIMKKQAVFVIPASGGELRQLTFDNGWKEGLEWHPDGNRLTYHLSRYDSETHQAYLDGRGPSLLVNASDVWDYVGIWAPDGRRFFFTGETSEKISAGILVYDESSGEITQVSEPGDSGVPSFSRDGKTMAWWATRQTGIQTWIMEDFLPESTAGQ
jgi:Tol biopolymer transport system component